MLTISAAGRRFPSGTEALRGVSLRIQAGDFIADQRREPAPESAGAILCGRIHAAALTRSRWISSPASLI